ncbi:MAG: hypothetical protein FWD74_12315, partial [Actinomycetia bacterium]|nr:hypothetical protein [Actinomycetes bacterium]
MAGALLAGAAVTVPLVVVAAGDYQLPVDRVSDWADAGLATIGGVPSANWPVCNATPLLPTGSPGGDTAEINAMIAACAAGTVVQLGPGKFEMGVNQFVLVNKGVVLRGAGVDPVTGAQLTTLDNPRNYQATLTQQNNNDPWPIVILGPGIWVNPDGDARCSGLTAYQPQYMQLLSADGAQGSSSVTVADGGIFHPGMYVLLDQTSGAKWMPDVTAPAVGATPQGRVWASPDYAVQWDLHDPAQLYVDDPLALVTPSAADNYAATGNGTDAGCWFSRQDRPQNEIKQIASVTGDTVTFTSPLTMGYQTAQHAELTTFTGSNQTVERAGVEDLAVTGGGNNAVMFNNTAYSWAKNIEVTDWYGAGVAFNDSFRDDLIDSYVHDGAWSEPGGAGYAISISEASSELLIQNNISMGVNKVMVARSSGAGSVVAYNYMDDGFIATTEAWIEAGVNGSHMVGAHSMLFEGNQSFNAESDDTHGNSTYMTFFRNYLTTVRAPFVNPFTGDAVDDATQAANGPKRAISAGTYSYWMSYVGNVLGIPGVTTAANGYSSESTDWTTDRTTMWMLGWNP